MFCQNFLSPRVGRCAVIAFQHGICGFLNELPNDFRFKILGNWEVSEKCLNSIE